MTTRFATRLLAQDAASAGRRVRLLGTFVGFRLAGAVIALLLAAVGTEAQPKTPPKAKPPVKEGGKRLPSYYLKIAQVISDQVQEHDPATHQLADWKWSDDRPTRRMLASLPDLKKARHPAVIAAVSRLVDGAEKAAAAKTAIRGGAGAADNMFGDVLKTALQGGYEQKVERTEVVRNSDGTTRLVSRTETVDGSAVPLLGAALLRGMVAASAGRQEVAAVEAAMEQARLEAWVELLPRLDALYLTSKPLAGRLAVRLDAPDPLTGRAAVRLTNTGREPLTNLTLTAELTHFTTAPHPTAIRVYFVTELGAGKTRWLSPLVTRNVVPTKDALVPRMTADPGYVDAWMDGAGGLVELKTAAWADQGLQPERAERFPDQAVAMAGWELDQVARLAARHLRPRKDAPNWDQYASTAPWRWAKQTAIRVRQFTPADSDPHRRADLLLNDPTAFLADAVRADADLPTRVLRPGRTFTGEWGVIQTRSVPSPWPAAEGSRRFTLSGRLVLRVDAFDKVAGTAAVTLFDPASPQRWKRMTGEVISGAEVEGGRLTVPGAVSRFTPGSRQLLRLDGVTAARGAADGGFFDTPDAIRVELDEVALIGYQESGQKGLTIPFSLRPTDGPKVDKLVQAADEAMSGKTKR